MVRFVIFSCFLICLSLTQCKKNDGVELTVEGRVQQSSNQAYIQGAQVTFSEKVLDGGLVSNSYDQLGETTTGSDGYFTFTFDRKNAVDYLVQVDHPSYFSETEVINPDDLHPDNPLSLNITLEPKAWLQVRLYNGSPEDNDDEVTFQTYNSELCNVQIVKEGTDVDTTFTCELVGDETIYYNYEVVRLSGTSSDLDSLFCPAFDTTFVNINY